MCAHQVRSYVALVNTDDRTTETSNGPTADHAEAQQYEIRVSGHLGTRWAAWFDGLELTARDDGTTVIRGPVVDQAALHGLLQKLRDIGIPLISLTQLTPGAEAEPSALHTRHREHLTRSNLMITVTGLTKRYGDRTAVDDLTFTVAAGRVTGFVGPNGAGKSTTMRMMVGLTPPRRGRGPLRRRALHRPAPPGPHGRRRCSTPGACTPAAPPGTTCGRWPR